MINDPNNILVATVVEDRLDRFDFISDVFFGRECERPNQLPRKFIGALGICR